MINDVAFLNLTEREKRELCPVPAPTGPLRDWRWWTLFIPNLFGAFGLFLFNVPGMGFVRLHSISTVWLNILVIGGTLAMMFGSDVGTLFAILEVFRKYAKRETQQWDWIGIIVSIGASISSSILSWAFQLYMVNVQADWIRWAKIYMPLFATTFIILDLALSGAEAGMYLGTYEKRLREWEKEDYEPWLRKRDKQINWELQEYPEATGEYAEDLLLPVDEQEIPITESLSLLREGESKNFIFIDGQWQATCDECEDFQKTYSTLSKARMGLAAHKRHRHPQVKTGNGDF